MAVSNNNVTSNSLNNRRSIKGRGEKKQTLTGYLLTTVIEDELILVVVDRVNDLEGVPS